jgi:hypothetical protein
MPGLLSLTSVNFNVNFSWINGTLRKNTSGSSKLI